MDKSKFEQLNSKELTLLIRQCEKLMQSHRATLDDYDVFVQCQQELAIRKVATTPRPISSLLAILSFLN